MSFIPRGVPFSSSEFPYAGRKALYGIVHDKAPVLQVRMAGHLSCVIHLNTSSVKRLIQ